MPILFTWLVPYIIGALGGTFLAAEIAVGVVTVLSYATFFAVVNAIQGALTGKNAETRGGEHGNGMEATLTDSSTAVEIVYGRVRKGGVNILPPWTHGTTGNSLNQVIALAGHEVAGYSGAQFDTDLIPIEAINTISVTSVSGAINSWLLPAQSATLVGQIRARLYTGLASNSQFVDRELNVNFPNHCNSWFRGAGIAYAALTYDWNDGKVFANRGLPAPTVDLFGRKVYDPRRDTSPGGNPTSATYAIPSNNPALCWADYKTNATFGRAVPAAEIDWNAIVTAANVCDGVVATPGFVSAELTDAGVTATHSASADGSIRIQRTAGGPAWDASVYGTTGYTSGHVGFSPNGTNMLVAVGWSSTPTTDNNYTSINYAFYLNGNTDIRIYQSGTLVKTITDLFSLAGTTPYDANTVFTIDYDGTFMRFMINKRLVYTAAVPTPGASYKFDSSLNTTAADLDLNVERRYTCNGALSSASDPNDNEKRLIDCLVGHMCRKGGLWTIYAGAWLAPTFALSKEDFVSVDAIQMTAPRDGGRYNGVRTYYTDPHRNWQRVECYPRYSDTYKSADAGERIWLEMEQPMCTEEYEAQRKSEFLLRQSRNGIRFQATLPPKFLNVATFDTVTLDFPELGWVAKPFRVISTTLSVTGSQQVVLIEEQSTDWTDLVASEYNTKSRSPLPDQFGPNYPAADNTLMNRYTADPDFTLAAPTFWGGVNTNGLTYSNTGGLSAGALRFISSNTHQTATLVGRTATSSLTPGTLSSGVYDLVRVDARIRVNSYTNGGGAAFDMFLLPQILQQQYTGSYFSGTYLLPVDYGPTPLDTTSYSFSALSLGSWNMASWYIGVTRFFDRVDESLQLPIQANSWLLVNFDIDYFGATQLGFVNQSFATTGINSNGFVTGMIESFNNCYRTARFKVGSTRIEVGPYQEGPVPIGASYFFTKSSSFSGNCHIITGNTSYFLRQSGGGTTEVHSITLNNNAFYNGRITRVDSWNYMVTT